MTKNAIKGSRIYLAKAEINFRLISKAHTKRKTIREKKKLAGLKPVILVLCIYQHNLI